jgi:hypothetical protein
LLYTEVSGIPDFYYSVNTGDNECYICPGGGANVNESNRVSALAWGNLATYDLSPVYSYRDVYIALKNYYAQTLGGELNDAAKDILEGNQYLGLSYLIQQQWEKECVNLNLYNRKMVYDQDFFVKNNIVIEPDPQIAGPFYNPVTDQSYAHPFNSNNEFTIETGVEVNMLAGESITLKPGFHAKTGCSFTASLDPSSCTDGHSLVVTGSNPTLSISTNVATVTNNAFDTESTKPYQNNLSVFPNPFNEFTNINYTVSGESLVTIKIVDFYGRIISIPVNNAQTLEGNNVIVFESKNLSKGIYYCLLEVNGQLTKVQKIVMGN